MIKETTDIHQEQKNMARYDSKVLGKCTNENYSKPEWQDEDQAQLSGYVTEN